MAQVRVLKHFNHVNISGSGIPAGVYDSEDPTIAQVMTDLLSSGLGVIVDEQPAPVSEESAAVDELIADEATPPTAKRKGK